MQKREYRVVYLDEGNEIQYTTHYFEHSALSRVAELEERGVKVTGRVVRDVGDWEVF